MDYETRISKQLNLETIQVKSAIMLLDDGNTIPFIARYRKEMTFNLDELQLRKIDETLQQFRAIDERRDTIIKSIVNQGKMTDSLFQQLRQADTFVELEDLYQPYKPRRVTRAIKAIGAGLEPLARQILNSSKSEIYAEATKYTTEKYPAVEAVLSGARDIVAQLMADDPDVRGEVRKKAMEWGAIRSTKINSAEDNMGLFKLYYDFQTRVKWIKAYQVLALNRAESEKVLRIKVEIADRDWLPIIKRRYKHHKHSGWTAQLEEAILDCGKRLLLPAIERDIRRMLTENAHEHAIGVFADNVRRLLLQPPLSNHVVMGIDPGFRTGCKVAIIDPTGKVLDTVTIYPNPPQQKYQQALDMLNRFIEQYNVTLIVIGNGTASRETEQLVAHIISHQQKVKYLIVNEAGASVYSASDIARQELPDLDVTLRGAVSIARRVQDPLAELVKIDPKSIGVGLYQHDLDQSKLANSLEWVVKSVVNQVGVDLNTGSISLLKHVSGISESIAIQIVMYRQQYGQFLQRSNLLNIKGVGDKTFEQAAGFLRIRNGVHWLDNSAIHPESYAIASKLLKLAKIDEHSTLEQRYENINNLLKSLSIEEMALRFDVGSFTIEDILEQIKRPGRDPREDIPTPILRSDILKMEDLKEGMILQGTIRNVVDFGAFVDIGVKQDGLLHSSNIPPDFNLQVGDVIAVRILSVDEQRGRIGLDIQ